MAQVNLNQVVKVFDRTEAVRGISLDIADQEFVVLVGPSGCGKSTTLRMVAGLEEVTAGEIEIGGYVVNDVPPKDRDLFKWRRGARQLSNWLVAGGLPPLDPGIIEQRAPTIVEPPRLASRRASAASP